MLLVTGAAGITGRHVVHELLDARVPMRALVSSRAAITPAEFGAAELMTGELTDGAALERALAGVDTLILITRVDPEQVALERHLVAAAERHGVRRLVKLSSIGAAPDAPFRVGRRHWQTERLLSTSRLEWVIVRAHRPMQHLYAQLGSLLGQQAFYGCQGDAPSADVDLRDVATVLARVAVSDAYTHTTVEVTGPAARTAYETAGILGTHMGRPVAYVDCAPADFVRGQMAGGVPRWLAEDRAAWQRAVQSGRFDRITSEVEHITGRRPRTYEAFAAEFAAAVRYAEAPRARSTATVRTAEYATPV